MFALEGAGCTVFGVQFLTLDSSFLGRIQQIEQRIRRELWESSYDLPFDFDNCLIRPV